MAFCFDHWHGTLPLKITFWVNFIAVLLLLSVLEPLLLSLFKSHPDRLVTITFISLFISRGMIYPWQVVGLIRAADTYYLSSRDGVKTKIIHAVIVLSFLYSVVYIVTTLQTVFVYKNKIETYSPTVDPPGYRLSIQKHGTQLRITGSLDIGITREIRAVIEKNPQITSVLLECPGGHIYQGRGLGKLILDHQLDTYVYKECSSACVTAYINGKIRYLGENGKIGFHQYKIDTTGILNINLLYMDLVSEQKQDLDQFKKHGIDPIFLEKIFNAPAEKIWFPDQNELLAAGVIHYIVEEKKEN